MCMKVDLPDPEGPVTQTNSPGTDVKGRAPQGAHLDVSDLVGLGQIPDRDDGAGRR